MRSVPTVVVIGILLLLLLLLLLFVITFMHGLYNYVLVNRPCVNSVAPLLWLQFIAHIMSFRTSTLVLFEVCALCPI
jgi:hypothetical protein